jgi:hypothetical protein
LYSKCRIEGIRDTYKAATCIGRQPKSDIWFFGERLQINGEGVVIHEAISSFLWVKEVFNLEEGYKRIENRMPLVTLPLSPYGLKDVVEALFKLLHDNSMAAVFTIGRYIYILDACRFKLYAKTQIILDAYST